VVVELGDEHRRLQPVVEHVAGMEPADPAEPRLVEVGFDLTHPGGARPFRQELYEGLGDVDRMLLHIGGHAGHADAFEWDDPVVLEGAGQVPFVSGVHPAGRHGWVDQVRVNAGRTLLLCGQRGHERGVQLDAVGEEPHSPACGPASISSGSAPQEDRRKSHPAVDDQAVDCAVVAV
jgi:hypothetical protein